MQVLISTFRRINHGITIAKKIKLNNPPYLIEYIGRSSVSCMEAYRYPPNILLRHNCLSSIVKRSGYDNIIFSVIIR